MTNLLLVHPSISLYTLTLYLHQHKKPSTLLPSLIIPLSMDSLSTHSTHSTIILPLVSIMHLMLSHYSVSPLSYLYLPLPSMYYSLTTSLPNYSMA